MITGESPPVVRGMGDKVVASTVVTDGSLRIEVNATGEGTALSGIQTMVQEAQESHSGTRLLADRAAAWLFYIAMGAAILTFAIHAFAGNVLGGDIAAVGGLTLLEEVGVTAPGSVVDCAAWWREKGGAALYPRGMDVALIEGMPGRRRRAHARHRQGVRTGPARRQGQSRDGLTGAWEASRFGRRRSE
jgi:hypothetical protein